MLRKIVLTAVVWGLLAVVPAEARVQTPVGNPSPNGQQTNGKTGKNLEARRGKKKGKRKGKRRHGKMKKAAGKKKAGKRQ